VAAFLDGFSQLGYAEPLLRASLEHVRNLKETQRTASSFSKTKTTAQPDTAYKLFLSHFSTLWDAPRLSCVLGFPATLVVLGGDPANLGTFLASKRLLSMEVPERYC